MVFEFDADWGDDLESLEQALVERRLRDCPKHAYFTEGWATPYKVCTNDLYLKEDAYCHLNLTKASRILPTSVIQAAVIAKSEEYERENAKAASSSLKKQFKEELAFELLPKAFVVEKGLALYIDNDKKRVYVDTASNTTATQVIALLVKTFGSMNLSKPFSEISAPVIFSSWLKSPSEIPQGLELGKRCKLTCLKEGKSSYVCKDMEYHLDELLSLIDSGLDVVEIELIWQDKMSFVLTSDLVIKGIKYLDVIAERQKEFLEAEDAKLILEANLLLMRQTLGGLTDFILSIFKSEKNLVDVQKVSSLTEAVA